MKRTLLSSRRNANGFTMIELMVSMAIFLIISSVAFRLFSMQQTSASILRDDVGLNLALRNAVTQLQLDVSNAGAGYYQNVNIPNWPVGVTIINNVIASGSTCVSGGNYSSTCFDTMNIIAAASPTTYPPVNASDSTGGSGTSNCSNTYSASSPAYAYTQAAVVNGTTWTLANTAAEFKAGDQLLFLKNDGSKMTTVVLTANGAVSGSAVKLTFNPTKNDGTNTYGSNDPLDITTCHGDIPCTASTNFTTQYCGSDYIIKLAPITYLVCAGPGSNATYCNTANNSPDIADPKLTRIQNGTANTVMEQVIGFRVGASIWNTSSGYDTSTTYQYNSACYTYVPTAGVPAPSSCTSDGNSVFYNFTLVRSVRASLVARTTPNLNAQYTFKNTFDGGPYQVEGTTIVVNPRNMSMND